MFTGISSFKQYINVKIYILLVNFFMKLFKMIISINHMHLS